MYNQEKVAIIRRYQKWEVYQQRYTNPAQMKKAMDRFYLVLEDLARVEETKHYYDGIWMHVEKNKLFMFRQRSSISGWKDPPEDG